jgi:hypothetical protein
MLPFPRCVVGTYSCHGIEPVCEEEDDDNHSRSSSSSSSSNDDDDDKMEQEGGKRRDAGSGKEDGVVVCSKINQDRGGIAYPYADSDRQALFSVYDGHGKGGELVSQYALMEVHRLLEARLRSMRATVGGGCGGGGEVDGGVWGRCGKVYDLLDDEGKYGEDDRCDRDVAIAMRDVFLEVDRALLDEDDIEVS